MHAALLKIVDRSVVLTASLAFAVIGNEAVREARNSPEEAIERCWNSVAAELASPEGAAVNEDLSRAVPRIRRRSDPTLWRVHLVVDERDASGATVREYYHCEIEHHPEGDDWMLLERAPIP